MIIAKQNVASMPSTSTQLMKEDEFKYCQSDIPKLPSVKSLAKMFQPNISSVPKPRKVLQKV